MIDKGIRYEVQGGVKNYLGKQKEVTATIKWQSSPDHPETELAYITKAEKDLLIKSDLHGSLKGNVNRGPSGIISLNGWGDASDGFGNAGGAPGPGDTGGEGGYSPRDNSTSQFGGSPSTSGGDAQDTKEQYAVARTITPITKEVEVAPITAPQENTGLERIRKINESLATQLTNRPFEGVNTPFAVANILGNFFGNFGYETNKKFFQENVAGNKGYGYGYEDFKDYMQDRGLGKVDAYGNPIDQSRGGDDGEYKINTNSGILENLLTDVTTDTTTSPTGFNYVPYSNQVVVAPGIEGLRSLMGSDAFKSIIK